MSNICTASVLLFAIAGVLADPPQPPAGWRWVMNYGLSDEFNGNRLDGNKWRNYFDGWKGREPAKFVPWTVSVGGGNMKIKNAWLPEPDGRYYIAGGAVQSKRTDAWLGYYEVRMRASRVMMSSTFWLSNKKAPLNSTGCNSDHYSQELDVVEAVGAAKDGWFNHGMKSNTHYRHIPCGQSKEVFHSNGAQKWLNSNVYNHYHTYGVWWKDEHHVTFYADNKQGQTVWFNTKIDGTKPFDRKMRINMVTETYDWARPYPTWQQLLDNNINTSYYDWIRSYWLVPANHNRNLNRAANTTEPELNIYKEKVILGQFKPVQATGNSLKFVVACKANKDRTLAIKLVHQNGSVVKEQKFDVFSGFGKSIFQLDLDEAPKKGSYKVVATLRDSKDRPISIAARRLSLQ